MADFIGESNIIDGIMHEDFKVEFAGHQFPCVDKGFSKNEEIQVVVRPEDIDITTPEKGQLTGIVQTTTFKGVHYEMMIDDGSFTWMVQSTDASQPGERVGMLIGPDDIHIMRKTGDVS